MTTSLSSTYVILNEIESKVLIEGNDEKTANMPQTKIPNENLNLEFRVKAHKNKGVFFN